MSSMAIQLAGHIYRSKNLLPLEHNVDQYYGYKITRCICNTTQLSGSFISTITSIISYPLSNMALEHTWMVLIANNPEEGEDPSTIYLVAQSYKDTLGLDIVESEEEGNNLGKIVSGRENDARHVGIHSFEPEKLTTVENVVEFMKENNTEYNLLANNCQHFVNKFTKEFGSSDDFEIVSEKSKASFIQTTVTRPPMSPPKPKIPLPNNLPNERPSGAFCSIASSIHGNSGTTGPMRSYDFGNDPQTVKITCGIQ